MLRGYKTVWHPESRCQTDWTSGDTISPQTTMSITSWLSHYVDLATARYWCGALLALAALRLIWRWHNKRKVFVRNTSPVHVLTRL